ncbi:MAG: hypothetical protein ACOY3I_00045 [Verrucomicrobiota bacterium]
MKRLYFFWILFLCFITISPYLYSQDTTIPGQGSFDPKSTEISSETSVGGEKNSSTTPKNQVAEQVRDQAQQMLTSTIGNLFSGTQSAFASGAPSGGGGMGSFASAPGGGGGSSTASGGGSSGSGSGTGGSSSTADTSKSSSTDSSSKTADSGKSNSTGSSTSSTSSGDGASSSTAQSGSSASGGEGSSSVTQDTSGSGSGTSQSSGYAGDSSSGSGTISDSGGGWDTSAGSGGGSQVASDTSGGSGYSSGGSSGGSGGGSGFTIPTTSGIASRPTSSGGTTSGSTSSGTTTTTSRSGTSTTTTVAGGGSSTTGGTSSASPRGSSTTTGTSGSSYSTPTSSGTITTTTTANANSATPYSRTIDITQGNASGTSTASSGKSNIPAYASRITQPASSFGSTTSSSSGASASSTASTVASSKIATGAPLNVVPVLEAASQQEKIEKESLLVKAQKYFFGNQSPGVNSAVAADKHINEMEWKLAQGDTITIRCDDDVPFRISFVHAEKNPIHVQAKNPVYVIEGNKRLQVATRETSVQASTSEGVPVTIESPGKNVITIKNLGKSAVTLSITRGTGKKATGNIQICVAEDGSLINISSDQSKKGFFAEHPVLAYTLSTALAALGLLLLVIAVISMYILHRKKILFKQMDQLNEYAHALKKTGYKLYTKTFTAPPKRVL